MRISQPLAIVLDVEGTTTDPTFTSRTLYPFIRNNLQRFLKETYNEKTTQLMIERLRATQNQFKSYDANNQAANEFSQSNKFLISKTQKSLKNMKLIPNVDDHRTRQVIQNVANFVKYLYEHQPNIIQLLELQLLMWVWAAENNLLKGQVFDEVPNCLHVWKRKNKINIFLFSSAVDLVQQLFFCCSNRGNLVPLIDGFFDYKFGNKTDPNSYLRIAENISIPPNKVLYITDSIMEGKAALEAGFKVIIIQRDPKHSFTPEQKSKFFKKFGFISSLEDVYFKT